MNNETNKKPPQSKAIKRTARTKYTHCQNCGKELDWNQINRRNRYCSRRCFCDAYYGEMKSVGGIETHSGKLAQAVELYLSGNTQSEAARFAGLDQGTVSRLIRKYDMAVLPDPVCAYCGETFSRTSRSNLRRFCSNKCSYKARYERERENHVYKRKRYASDLKGQALELYWGGLGGAAIARYLDVAQGTVSSWIHDFGGSRERVSIPEVVALVPPVKRGPPKAAAADTSLPPRKRGRPRLSAAMDSGAKPINAFWRRVKTAETAAQWAQMLREAAKTARLQESREIRLVCGTVRGNSSSGILGTIVMDKLKENPCGGSAYVFCNMSHDTVIMIKWIGGSFKLLKLRKPRGAYFVWPDGTLGASILVGAKEFKYLLAYRKYGLINDKKLDFSPFI